MTAPTVDRFPTVTLVEPSSAGYLLFAAEVDRRPPWLPASRRKRRLLDAVVRALDSFRDDGRVLGATVFRAFLVPPGTPHAVAGRPVPRVRYDIVVLVETTSPVSAAALAAERGWRGLAALADGVTRRTYEVRATNQRRIGPVDHGRDGVFLFNWFLAADRDENLAAWQHTAGWFQSQTGLDNSTLLLPVTERGDRSTFVNHCRWDRLRDVLPGLLFAPSFRNYVLAHFRARETAPRPLLYRRVATIGSRGRAGAAG